MAAAGDPVLDHRDLHRHAHGRLHPQQPDHARAVALDGHRHRRRHHRAGEHLPAHRGGAAAARSRPPSTGTKEISLAVTATTLSLVVIFLPVAFMGGLVGKFWNSFGLTATFAIMVSLLVAFTLTPMLAARILSRSAVGTHGETVRGLVQGRRALPPARARYEAALGWCLRHRVVCLAATALIFVGGWYPAHEHPAGVRGRRRHERVRGGGRGAARLLDRAQRADRARDGGGDPDDPGGHHALHHGRACAASTSPMSPTSRIYVGLKPLRGAQALAAGADEATCAQQLAAFPGMRVSVQNISLIGGGGFRQTPFNLILRGPDLPGSSSTRSGVIRDLLKAKAGFVDLDTAQASASRRSRCTSTAAEGLGPRRAGGRHRGRAPDHGRRREGGLLPGRRRAVRRPAAPQGGVPKRRLRPARPHGAGARAARWSSSPTSPTSARA